MPLTPKTTDDFVSIALLQMEVDGLRKEVAEQTAATKELVEAWKAAGKMVAFVKWTSTLVTALGILWVFVKHFWAGRFL